MRVAKTLGAGSMRVATDTARRGRNAGGFKTQNGITYAPRLRRDLKRALVAHRVAEAERLGVPLAEVPEFRWELFKETDTTLPVDFHSFRRAYNTALAESGVNVQKAMALAAHSDPRVHERYVMSTKEMRTVPERAIPALPSPIVLQQTVAIRRADRRNLEPPSRVELETYGLRRRENPCICGRIRVYAERFAAQRARYDHEHARLDDPRGAKTWRAPRRPWKGDRGRCRRGASGRRG